MVFFEEEDFGSLWTEWRRGYAWWPVRRCGRGPRQWLWLQQIGWREPSAPYKMNERPARQYVPWHVAVGYILLGDEDARDGCGP